MVVRKTENTLRNLPEILQLDSYPEVRKRGGAFISLQFPLESGPKITQRRPGPLERMIKQLTYVSVVAAALTLFCSQALGQGRDASRIRTVVLDAGHGGKDHGNLGTGRFKTTEKDVSLNVVRLIGKYIKEAYPNVNVIYTREDDRFIELMERTNIANKAKADVFISIHCNANENHSPNGCETYVMGLHKTEANMRVAQKENAAILMEDGHELKYDGYDPKDPESMIALGLLQNTHMDQSLLLSSLIQKQFRERVGRPDRGVKQAGFLVISYTTMPAVLVELGFLTNATEEEFLQGELGQDYMASAVYRAFKEYKDSMEGVDTTTASILPEKPNDPEPDPASAPPEETPSHSKDAIRFKVQIATTSKHVDPKPRNFNGLEGVEEYKSAGLFRYSIGNEHSLEGARAVQKRCRDVGYDGAFIVAYRNDQRMDLQEALKLAQGQ